MNKFGDQVLHFQKQVCLHELFISVTWAGFLVDNSSLPLTNLWALGPIQLMLGAGRLTVSTVKQKAARSHVAVKAMKL
jgi:hypothetical protein